MEYERFHLVSLFKEVVQNACTQLFIISFLKNEKEIQK
jgi:hypothetical protein